MYVCVCVCMCVCIYIDVCVCVCVCVHCTKFSIVKCSVLDKLTNKCHVNSVAVAEKKGEDQQQ